jgi:hypothetical protein
MKKNINYPQSKEKEKQRGMIIIHAIVFGSVALVLISGLVTWAAINIKASKSALDKELAFQIAEAGIDYYRWHLAHDPNDFEDGTGAPGPYVHDFLDKNDKKIGEFSLDITPPSIGSTIVVIRSKGTVSVNSGVSSEVEVQLAIPSLAKYAVAANSDMRFGGGTEVFGPIHSNGGIRFDGLAHNIVSSSRGDYDDPDHSGANEFGVHTHLAPTDPLPPNPVPSRGDVFEAGRQFPVPAVDFTGFTSDLAQIKTDAQSDGFYFPDSGNLGYKVILRNDDKFELYRVTSVMPRPNFWCSDIWSGEDRWGIWGIRNESYIGTYAFPSNGLIFLEDDVWVEGSIDTARLTIASGKFPENPATYTNIIVNNDIEYTNYDGTDAISLMAQGDFGAGLYADTDLRVDAALIAQNGRVGMNFYHPWACGLENTQKNSITLYGIIATNKRYGFAWGCGAGCFSGYTNRNIIYDANLLYGPPPSFPLTASQYITISWKKIR